MSNIQQRLIEIETAILEGLANGTRIRETLAGYYDELKPTPKTWLSIYAVTEFQHIRLEVLATSRRTEKTFTAEDIRRISGCLGYALMSKLHGENLSEPEIVENYHGGVVLDYYYDSTKALSDDWDATELVSVIKQTIYYGSPIRKTNKAGKGTQGTRLVEGVGDGVNVYIGVA